MIPISGKHCIFLLTFESNPDMLPSNSPDESKTVTHKTDDNARLRITGVKKTAKSQCTRSYGYGFTLE